MGNSDLPRHALSDEEIERLAAAVCRQLAAEEPPLRLVEALAAMLHQRGISGLPLSRPGRGAPVPIGPYEIPAELLEAGWDRAASEDDDPDPVGGPPSMAGQSAHALTWLAEVAAGPRPSRAAPPSGPGES